MPGPSWRRPSCSMKPWMMRVSIPTFSSPSPARAGEPAAKNAAPSRQPTARRDTSRAPDPAASLAGRRSLIRSRTLVIPRGYRVLDREYCVRSGRFLGAFPNQGFIQQTNDAGNDGGVGEVKDVPAELPSCGGNVKKHEIGDPAISQPVDGIADRPADDQAERQRGQAVL